MKLKTIFPRIIKTSKFFEAVGAVIWKAGIAGNEVALLYQCGKKFVQLVSILESSFTDLAIYFLTQLPVGIFQKFRCLLQSIFAPFNMHGHFSRDHTVLLRHY